VKLYHMAPGKGFRVVARSLGRIEGTGYTGLNFWERLTFFRSELLVEFILIPLALLVLYRYLPRVLRILFSALVSGGVAFALYVQFLSLEEVGRYIPFHIIMAAIIFGMNDTGARREYLFTPALFALLVGLGFIAGSVWWAAKRDRADAESPEMKRDTQKFAAVSISALLLVTGLAWRPLLPFTPLHENVLWSALRAYWHEGEINTREFAGLSLEQLEQQYRAITNSPVLQPDLRYFGKDKGANVIFFILETLPSRFLPAGDPLDEFPNLRRLQPKSFIADEHYTTYPYTTRAFFSLFSGCYPSDGVKTFGEQYPGVKYPGLTKVLGEQGYETALYAPSTWTSPADKGAIGFIGFGQSVFPDPGTLPLFAPKDVTPEWKANRLALDLASLHTLKQDADRWLSEGRHFAIVFFPQASHDPYPDMVPPEEESNHLKRARGILRLYDSWVGEILQVLEQHQALENTIFVVTGDHGVRTRREDPSFPNGMIDEYAFHVPLQIYAPGALESPVHIPWRTSHIDVTPTVLDLLGIDQGRQYEQGAAIWNPALADRAIYFFAMQTFGSDGYYSQGRYFMWSQMTDAVYANSSQHFEARDLLPRNSTQARDATRSISRMISLQQAWVSQVVQSEQVKAGAAKGGLQ
jgi:arylsulfatase A-like enzyme